MVITTKSAQRNNVSSIVKSNLMYLVLLHVERSQEGAIISKKRIQVNLNKSGEVRQEIASVIANHLLGKPFVYLWSNHTSPAISLSNNWCPLFPKSRGFSLIFTQLSYSSTVTVRLKAYSSSHTLQK